ncbi:recombinase family protein [Erythrobacter crassostreae]|uniref:Recombinase family protein n=1 Tax=Erythrobacter crassostreae TaxID=2828328 RepID=A0A9X1F2V9_9SPHN|nr:recombinase family protein [Erythrobacter crassostrea]MBV7258981.1 recombinase family protein [Erythrobacter crassostrea]
MAKTDKKLRCAIYTRKSTDEGLDKDFNSLDAQREACAAYVQSQQHEGWTLLPELYDDGGHSGGTLERPALQHLLTDVEAGKVDVVVVYKIDRLTRSLADFAKIVDVLDEAEASFVSVTQAFSTTSSMGRLTLNVLLSFAQFEREVGAERIRDKIAASKAKGMWMGGGVPMGYDAVDRKLVVIHKEAGTVRKIMQRYLEADSIKALVQELARDGIVSKRRTSKRGNVSGGVPIKRGALKYLLSNPIYVGEVRHKEKTYPGLHEAIVDRETFDAVQTKLKERTSPGSAAGNQRRVALLAGMIRDDRARPMSPTHTKNHGRRYTYYASNMNDDDEAPALRLPASEIEQSIRRAIAKWLRANANIQRLAASRSADEKKRVFETTERLAADVEHLPASKASEVLNRLALRVVVNENEINGSFEPATALELNDSEVTASFEAKFRIRLDRQNYGHEARMRLQPSEPNRAVRNNRLVELLGRAFAARDELQEMDEEAVQSSKTTKLRHLQRLARLSYLDPTIIRSILKGTQPKNLSARSLWRMGDMPIHFADQRAALGFSNS